MSEIVEHGGEVVIENPLVVEQRQNRAVITALQAEQRQLLQRVGEIKLELQERWTVDASLGAQIRINNETRI